MSRLKRSTAVNAACFLEVDCVCVPPNCFGGMVAHEVNEGTLWVTAEVVVVAGWWMYSVTVLLSELKEKENKQNERQMILRSRSTKHTKLTVLWLNVTLSVGFISPIHLPVCQQQLPKRSDGKNMAIKVSKKCNIKLEELGKREAKNMLININTSWSSLQGAQMWTDKPRSSNSSSTLPCRHQSNYFEGRRLGQMALARVATDDHWWPRVLIIGVASNGQWSVHLTSSSSSDSQGKMNHSTEKRSNRMLTVARA